MGLSQRLPEAAWVSGAERNAEAVTVEIEMWINTADTRRKRDLGKY